MSGVTIEQANEAARVFAEKVRAAANEFTQTTGLSADVSISWVDVTRLGDPHKIVVGEVTVRPTFPQTSR